MEKFIWAFKKFVEYVIYVFMVTLILGFIYLCMLIQSNL